MKYFITLITAFLLTASLSAQTRVVHGKLVTFNTYPVENVEVKAKKAGTSALTDSLGRFSIVTREKDVLKIKPKTFKSVTQRLGPDTDSVTLNLIFVDNERNRKMAVGYGYVDERDLTYAVSNLQHENNEFCNYSDIYELLAGRFAGVVVENRQVIIRGRKSFYGSNEALYVVDGVVVNSIDWISPCEVKSINILKDSSAAAYGSRGANGVVLIDLFRGTMTGN